MTPEDLAEVKALLRLELDYKEPWSWAKFLKGPFDGKNYAKAIVIGICMLIILTIGYSLYKLFNPMLKHSDTSSSKISHNQGTITTEDSHATSSVIHNHSPLENGILGAIFGSKDQVIKESKGD